MKVFRHKQSDSFMCLSFLLTFVVAVIAMGYLNDAFSREISEQEHSYQNSVTVYVSNEQGFDDAFLEYLEQRDIQGIMMISEFTVSVDKADVEYGEIHNNLKFNAFKSPDSVVYRFDMNIKGTAAKNIRYVTDKEIEMFGNQTIIT